MARAACAWCRWKGAGSWRVLHTAGAGIEGADDDAGDSRNSADRGGTAAGQSRPELPDLLAKRQLPVAESGAAAGHQEGAFQVGACNRSPLDESSPSLVRDPNKCVLCGDCVRMCSEIQGIGAIDFAHRGHEACVQPAFGKQLGEVECVNCGQCASVCPTGALTVKSEVDEVWEPARRPHEKGSCADCAGRARGPGRVLWAASRERSPPDGLSRR